MAQVLTEFDTIAAISTPIGEGGISIVRMLSLIHICFQHILRSFG